MDRAVLISTDKRENPETGESYARMRRIVPVEILRRVLGVFICREAGC